MKIKVKKQQIYFFRGVDNCRLGGYDERIDGALLVDIHSPAALSLFRADVVTPEASFQQRLPDV